MFSSNNPVCVKEKHIEKDPGIFSLLRENFLHITANRFPKIHGEGLSRAAGTEWAF